MLQYIIGYISKKKFILILYQNWTQKLILIYYYYYYYYLIWIITVIIMTLFLIRSFTQYQYLNNSNNSIFILLK